MNTKISKTLVFHIFLNYFLVFLAFGLIYISIFRDISPRWWILLWYPLYFLVMWFVVFLAVQDSLNKILKEEVSDLGAKKVWKIGVIVSVVSVMLWALIRILSVAIIPQVTDWIVPVDLSGFNFFSPSSIVQGLLLLTTGAQFLLLFPLQFFGAIIFLAALIVSVIQYKIQPALLIKKSAGVVLLAGTVLMMGAQAVYMYYFYKLVPSLSAQTSFSDQNSSVNETVGWKTYRSDKYGIELRYPPSANIIEGIEYPDGLHPGFRIADSKANVIFAFEYYTSLDEISMGAPLPRKSIEDSLKYDYPEVKKILFDNATGYKVLFYNPVLSYSEDQIWVEHNGGIYVFSYNSHISNENEVDLDSEMIVSSIRWLK